MQKARATQHQMEMRKKIAMAQAAKKRADAAGGQAAADDGAAANEEQKGAEWSSRQYPICCTAQSGERQVISETDDGEEDGLNLNSNRWRLNSVYK